MKFSIIIPVFNVAKELPRTIESLRRQAFDNFEIVLVDDGSTDGSSELVDAYSDIATVLHQKNQGVMVARQNGFKASSGEWILFVDGDDAIKPETLLSVKEEVDRTDVNKEMVCFGFEVVYGNIREEFGLPLSGNFLTSELINRMKTTPLEFIGSCIGNKCYRREIVDAVFTDVGNANISFHEDTLFAFSAFLRTKSISFLQGCFYEYIQRNGSARNRFNDRVVDEEEQFILSVERTAQAAGRLSSRQIEECLDCYCRAASSHVFAMFIANRTEYDAGLQILHRLNKSKFFRRFNLICNSPRQKMIRFALQHPRFYCRLSPILHFINIVRKVVRRTGAHRRA